MIFTWTDIIVDGGRKGKLTVVGLVTEIAQYMTASRQQGELPTRC